MSRLSEKDIAEIEGQLEEYDQLFYRQTGYTMEEIACKTANFHPYMQNKEKAAVITVTSGLGEIGGFASSVAAILRHCKIQAEIMEKTDVAGLQQAYREKARIAFMADDDACVAFGIGRAVHSDNGEATGKGFAAALIAAMEKRGVKIKGQEVLVIGAGPVGAAAACYLAAQEAAPVIYDLKKERAACLAAQITGAKVAENYAGPGAYKYILEASTAAEIITERDVDEQSIIAAPGMPCGISGEAKKVATVIHNPLELGILVMYFACCAEGEEKAYETNSVRQ